LRKQIEEQRAEGGKVIYALTFASQQKDLGCTAGGRLRRGRRTRRKSISRSANQINPSKTSFIFKEKS